MFNTLKCLFNKYLKEILHMPGIVLGTGDMVVSKMDKILALVAFFLLVDNWLDFTINHHLSLLQNFTWW